MNWDQIDKDLALCVKHLEENCQRLMETYTIDHDIAECYLCKFGEDDCNDCTALPLCKGIFIKEESK